MESSSSKSDPETIFYHLGCFQAACSRPAFARPHVGEHVTAAASSEDLCPHKTLLHAVFLSCLLVWTAPLPVPQCLRLPHRGAILSSGASSHLSLILFWFQPSLLKPLPALTLLPPPLPLTLLPPVLSLSSTSAATLASLLILRCQTRCSPSRPLHLLSPPP